MTATSTPTSVPGPLGAGVELVLFTADVLAELLAVLDATSVSGAGVLVELLSVVSAGVLVELLLVVAVGVVKKVKRKTAAIISGCFYTKRR